MARRARRRRWLRRPIDAADYDELVDHPVELGRFWRGRFSAGRRARTSSSSPAPGPTSTASACSPTRRGSARRRSRSGTARRPGRRSSAIVFLLNAVDDGHGGLEHRASTALIAPRRDLPRREAGRREGRGQPTATSTSWASISHEYFHAWNVKRMRPREFERYDYSRENYTGLLWFFEGFTSYYDDLFLLRAGLIDAARYLKLVARTLIERCGDARTARAERGAGQLRRLGQVLPQRREHARTPPSATTPRARWWRWRSTCTLRAEGKGSLDDVLRRLWSRSGGGPIDEADIAGALEAVGGRAYADELAQWVHGTVRAAVAQAARTLRRRLAGRRRRRLPSGWGFASPKAP